MIVLAPPRFPAARDRHALLVYPSTKVGVDQTARHFVNRRAQSMTAPRSGHTATLLTSGKVLIAGGADGVADASAELYDPATGVFTRTGDMTAARTGHTATALAAQDGAQNGDLLIVGTDGSADLYDPTKGTFARIGSLLPSMQPSYAHTANLPSDGTVLAAGGYGTGRCGRRGPAHFSRTAAALFAPESDGFTATGSLNASRDTHTATVLADGTVLIVGGTEHCGITYAAVLSSAELFK
jgi:Galactose oxidase, central domain